MGNRVEGNIGNNILTGLGGNDILIGGFGTDTANYGPYGAAVVVNLSSGTATSGAKTDIRPASRMSGAAPMPIT